jgi:hypothetical protein
MKNSLSGIKKSLSGAKKSLSGARKSLSCIDQKFIGVVSTETEI